MIKRFFCLFFPIAAAFGGFFLATPIWKQLLKKTSETPELLKFFLCLACFCLISLLVFLLTRKENPIITIDTKDVL